MSSVPTMSGRADPKSSNETASSPGQHVELTDMGSSGRKIPIEEDIMQLARLGEIAAIQKLFDSGKFDATYRDEEGITPLHWAATNNHYALCHFLIQSGANINAKGGEAQATPVLWAARKCHYYVVHLLIEHGANPLLTDDQGFNLLHSATLDGNVFQLILLLHQDIPVDIPDSHGHTSLMWAAYKGFPACVDLFLKWGANVYSRDDEGFTALHWALVKGSYGPIQKLIEYGSDRFAENNSGKTPSVTAQDMNSVKQWHKALQDCGYNSDGSAKANPFSYITKDRKAFLSKFYFLWPFLEIPIGLYIFSHMVIYAAIPIGLFVLWAMQWSAQALLRWAPHDMNNIHRTPFLSGVFAGSLFWIGVRYLTHILPATYWTNPFLNLIFFPCFCLTGYFFYASIVADPGFVPKPGSRSQQKAGIDELIEAKKFDDHNFCTACMIRKPLRAKHCRRCHRCVAKEDHHCPWINNCVGINNHRQFVCYVAFLEMGLVALIWLVLAYLTVLSAPTELHCDILSEELCAYVEKDSFTVALTIWVALQLVWVTMLLFVQLVQIARAMTTYEAMKGNLHGHGVGDAVTSFATTGSLPTDGGPVTGGSSGPERQGARHQHKRKEGFFAQWKRLLGLDTFWATAIHGSNAPAVQARQRTNPFTRGIITNCKDFWCDPQPYFGHRENGMTLLGGERVDYTKMYEPPPRMTTRRVRDTNYVAVNADDSV